MPEIPFAQELRQHLGYPSVPILVGPGSVCRKLAETRPLSRLDPEFVFEKASLEGPQRILLIDELLAHGDYSAAYDLTTYLASSPSEFPSSGSEPEGLGQSALENMAFLREVAALAAIQGGLYRRADVTLLQARQLLRSIRSTSLVKPLLVANRHLLLARLAQVQGLPQFSLREVLKAKQLFKDAGREPRGIEILEARSELHRDPSAALKILDDCRDEDQIGSQAHVLGPLAGHYFHYLKGRAHLELEQWQEAKEGFEASRAALDENAHAGVANPLRVAFLGIGLARTKIGRGKLGLEGDRQVDEGLKQVREAIGIFRQLNFTAGEYQAFSYWLAQADVSAQSAGATIQYHKDLHDLAQRSGVLRFEVDSGFSYAKQLFDYGRPIAASAVLDRLMVGAPPKDTDAAAKGSESTAKDSESFAAELLSDPVWVNCQSLQVLTKHAMDNSISPRALWGLSKYAHAELSFVEAVCQQADRGIVSVYGPSGSGRRLLLDRLAKARGGPRTQVDVVSGVKRSFQTVRSALDNALARNADVVLYDVDLWAPETQHRMAEAIRRTPDSLPRIFAALSERLEVAEHKTMLVPGMLSLLPVEFTWNIDPLVSRPQDTLLLARGFLVSALQARGASLEEVRPLIFTSAAANFIRDRYSQIRELAYAMKLLASGLRLEFDVFDSEGGNTQYKKVPHEVVSRLLAHASPVGKSSPGGRAMAGKDVSEDILAPTEARVQELAIEFKGKLQDLAARYKIPRTSLIRAWKDLDLLDVWYEAGGRRHRPSRW
jgi:tetratricopeptide (TPR) repeat protein